MKSCTKCGQKFMEEFGTGKKPKWCPDCREPFDTDTRLSSLGCEDAVTHFEQDIGFRLQRMAWGHFDG